MEFYNLQGNFNSLCWDLKFLIACRDNNGNDISIPYGAIKSIIYVDDVEVMQGDFNSLWCD